MEFYDLLTIVKIKDQDLWWVPVSDYFKAGDKLLVSFQDDVIILRKKNSGGVAEFLAKKEKLAEVKKDANGLWVLLPEWLVGLLSSKVEYFAVALDEADFSGVASVPSAIALKPIKGKSVTLEAPKPAPMLAEKELKLIDISRGKKPMDISKTLEFNKEIVDLSTKMLKGAFGEDFDTEVGKPKVVR